MKCIGYVGVEGDCVVIQQPTDIYPLLDWCQSRMMDNQEECNGTKNKEKWQKAIDYLSELMEQVERDGFGSIDYVDVIQY